MTSRRPAVLFVCLGNICRSPLAEAALRLEAAQAGLDIEIDSAGTGDWHVGKPPDPRAQAAARQAGIDISHLAARQVEPGDFRRFDRIFAMDSKNLAALRALEPEDSTAEVSLLLDLVEGREGASLRDPYLDGQDPFDYTWQLVCTAARALVRRLAD